MLPFKVALLNVAWVSPNSNQTRYFNSVSEQQAYFDNLSASLFSGAVNLQVRDNVHIDLTYTETHGRALLEMLRLNYCIVVDERTNEYRYYFASLVQLSGDNYRVTLELDDIQTNYFKYKNDIQPCRVNRAHLDRFIKQGNDYVFNNDPSSYMLISEGLTPPKRSVERKRVNYRYTTDEITQQWLDENVLCWVYVFGSGDHGYELQTLSGYNPLHNTINMEGTMSGGAPSMFFDLGYVSFCYPIMKTAEEFYFSIPQSESTNTIVKLGQSGYNYFKQNNATDHFFSIKMSQIPPFNYLKGRWNYATTPKFIIDEVSGCSCVQVKGESGMGREWGLFTNITQTKTTFESNPVDMSSMAVKTKFTAAEIKTFSNEIDFNPKLLTTDFLEVNLQTTEGQSFAYDMLKYGSADNLTVYHTEMLMTETTRQYTRLKAQGLYTQMTEKAFYGLVTQIDNSLTIINDAYQSFLASNKNFHAQASFNMNMNMAKGVMSGVNGAISAGMKGGGYAAAASGVTSAISVGMDRYAAEKTHEFATDNLQNSPDSIRAASGNIVFTAGIQQLGTYIEVKRALDVDLTEVNNYMRLFGFKYGRITHLREVDNIRVGYNYIEAIIETITAPISNIEKDRLKDRLSSITFFNSDNFSTDQINYERSIT